MIVVTLVVSSHAQESTSPSETLPSGAIARLGVVNNPHRGSAVQGIAISPDGQKVATRSVTHVCRIWDANSGKLLQEFEPFLESRLHDISFSHDGKQLLTITNNEEVARPLLGWDVVTGDVSKRMEFAGNRLEFARKGEELLALRYNQLTRFSLDAPNQPKISFLKTNRESAIPMALNQDQTAILLYVPPRSNSSRHQLIVHQTADSNERGVQGFMSQILDVASSPRTNQIVVACKSDARLHIRDTKDRREMLELSGHADTAQAVEYTPDGRFIISVSADGRARIWDTLSMQALADVSGHGDRLVSLAISRDGNRFVTGSSGRKQNCAIVWDLQEILFPQAELKPQARRNLKKAWKQLGDSKVDLAFKAMNEFYWNRQDAMQIFQQEMAASARPITKERIVELIEQLDAPTYFERTRAYNELVSVRRVAIAPLQDRLKRSGSVELRLQIRRILSVDTEVSPETAEQVRRLTRAFHLLELFGDEPSLKLVQQVAKNHTNKQINAEAKFVLSRMR